MDKNRGNIGKSEREREREREEKTIRITDIQIGKKSPVPQTCHKQSRIV